MVEASNEGRVKGRAKMTAMLEARKLLIVDDEKELREIIAQSIDHLGIEYRLAADGVEALEMLRSESFEAVLCDIKMPRMGGLDLLKEITNLGLDLPFIVLTGHGDKGTVLQALQLGALDFLDKPFAFDEIKRVIERAIEIGVRRKRLKMEMSKDGLVDHTKVEHEEKMISLLKLTNFSKRK